MSLAVADEKVASPATRSHYPRLDHVLVLAAVSVVLGVLPGPQNALVLLGVLTTFYQPLQTYVAAWTSWRPRTVPGALCALAVLLAAAAGVTVTAQAAVGHVDLVGLVTTRTQDHGHPVLSTFPVLITPAALVFVVFLQITMVWERKPFDRIRGPWAGAAALAASTVVAIVAYQTLTNWKMAPPSLHAAGLRDPGGPIAGSSIATWLICVAAWQVVVMLVLNGSPGTLLGSTSGRVVVNNVTVLGAASASYWLAEVTGMTGPTLAAVAASVVAGSRVAVVLSDSDAPAAPRQRVIGAVLGSVAVYAILRLVVVGATFTAQPAGLWMAVVALNLVSGSVTFLTDLLPRRPKTTARNPSGLS